jgi:hypothetical protein
MMSKALVELYINLLFLICRLFFILKCALKTQEILRINRQIEKVQKATKNL